MKVALLAISLAGLLVVPVLGEEAPARGSEAPPVGGQARVLVAYYSVTGHTRAMAEAVAGGAGSVSGVTVRLFEVESAPIEEVLAADAIVLGSPVYSANVAPAVLGFINRWPFEGAPLRDKIGAAFATGGGISAGEETVQLALLRSMLVFGMIVVGGPEWPGAFGASAVTEEGPFGGLEDGAVAPRFLEKGRALGRRVAELALRLRAAASEPGDPAASPVAPDRAPPPGQTTLGPPDFEPHSPSAPASPDQERSSPRRGSVAAVPPWSAVLLFALVAAAGGSAPAGGGGGEIGPCPRSPNCVSSRAADSGHRVGPFELAVDPETAWETVRQEVAALPRTRVVTAEETYVAAECRSAVFGFVDDLELALDASSGRIDVRSASRTGHWDLGVNRRRVEELRRRLRERGAIR